VAELLVCVTDKATGQVGAIMAGDVVCVCADGHLWSDRERANPDWRIVKFPGVDPAWVSDYQQAQIDVTGRVVFKRAVGVDMTTAVGSWLLATEQESTLAAESVIDLIDATVQREAGGVL